MAIVKAKGLGWKFTGGWRGTVHGRLVTFIETLSHWAGIAWLPVWGLGWSVLRDKVFGWVRDREIVASLDY